MMILFFKAATPSADDEEENGMPLADKMRVILQQKLEAADNEVDRDRWQRNLDKLNGAK